MRVSVPGIGTISQNPWEDLDRRAPNMIPHIAGVMSKNSGGGRGLRV